HAGIINAGGFLLIRLSPLLQHSLSAHFLLACLGSLTAIYGALVMMTQNSIKKKLAFSTISQMGLMMVCCGFGAYSLALFHMISHSLYKAHAFLSTGDLVSESRKAREFHPSLTKRSISAFALIGLLVVVTGLIAFQGRFASELTYAAILFLGFAQNHPLKARVPRGARSRFFGTVLFVFLLALGFSQSVGLWMHGQISELVPDIWKVDGTGWTWTLVYLISYLIFCGGLYLSYLVSEVGGGQSQRLKHFFWNGAYFSQWTSRLLGRWKIGPLHKPTLPSTVPAEAKPFALREVLDLVAPSWPLQSLVATNPFWFARAVPFEDVMGKWGKIFGTPFYMPIEYYRELWNAGQIPTQALERALEISDFPNKPTLAELIGVLRGEAELKTPFRSLKTLSEWPNLDADLNSAVLQEVGKFCAGYFDERQSIAGFSPSGNSFWNAWINAQASDRGMEVLGFKGFSEFGSSFGKFSSQQAISFMLKEMNLIRPDVQVAYCQRLLATVIGWSSLFKYTEWQKQLGYPMGLDGNLQDLLAVRMVYDLAFRFVALDEGNAVRWQEYLDAVVTEDFRLDRETFPVQRVLQRAIEQRYQSSLLKGINWTDSDPQAQASAQLVFCIDVRSEMIRRNIEKVSSLVQTRGFAGFFGLPVSYRSKESARPSSRLPVLLAPAFEIGTVIKDRAKDIALTSQRYVSDYFYGMRKYPLSSFLFVEMFGALYVFKLFEKTFSHFSRRHPQMSLPVRFDFGVSELSQELKDLKNGQDVSVEQKVEIASSVLKHMGLVRNFAEIVMIVGHGSNTTNNAFAAALDCGACGGHAGDINARFLCGLLNNSFVRQGLLEKGITIPAQSYFLPAIHETVTDKIFFLEPENEPAALQEKIRNLRQILDQATSLTQREREFARSSASVDLAERRSQNWSEVRPEWALAGNASFIVAPRTRTLGMNLESRSFLHDYDWKQDQASGFATLELIMTAPMVVTNWINMQYYASTTAPLVFGSGNKVLHNITNETGVVEGNGGDLRIGLPFQSVHDGQKFVHEPLRLSVLIEAPTVEVEKVVQRHEVVKSLVENGWLDLFVIDRDLQQVTHRMKDGNYSDRF
ncbi:MAG: Na-translocating system protein MpsB, partial [Bdellovibrionales bacterium]|nr:Na-translocating system protein MpsB [Bdellovibrionales bacterium]